MKCARRSFAHALPCRVVTVFLPVVPHVPYCRSFAHALPYRVTEAEPSIRTFLEKRLDYKMRNCIYIQVCQCLHAFTVYNDRHCVYSHLHMYTPAQLAWHACTLPVCCLTYVLLRPWPLQHVRSFPPVLMIVQLSS
jgi:hypothetical protein